MGADPSGLVAQVSAFVRDQALFVHGETVVVAVSGGADSVVLLNVLEQLAPLWGLRLVVAHLDHGTRGAGGADDAAFVRELAKARGFRVQIERTDVPALAKREGRSLEEAARACRYGFLRRAAAAVGARSIALGHTQDDQAETVLLQLFRGTGRAGSGGMAPRTAEGVVRPLLCVGREDVRRFCRDRGISWREDPTNADLAYTRNWLRHEVMSRLGERFGPAVAGVIARQAGIVRAEEAFLEEVTESAHGRACAARSARKIQFDVEVLASYHVAVRRRVLHSALAALSMPEGGWPLRVVERLEKLSSGERPVSLGPDVRAQVAGGRLVIVRGRIAFCRKVPLPGSVKLRDLGLELRVEQGTGGELRSDSEATAYLDAATVMTPLEVRSPRPGDTFCPAGRSSDRAVRSFLARRGVPVLLRDEVPLLTDRRGIVWMAGHAVDTRCQPTSATKSVIRASLRGAI